MDNPLSIASDKAVSSVDEKAVSSTNDRPVSIASENPLSIREMVRLLLNNPPGLNGVEFNGVCLGNAHIDHGWKAALTKVLEFIEVRNKAIDNFMKTAPRFDIPTKPEGWEELLVIGRETTPLKGEDCGVNLVWDANNPDPSKPRVEVSAGYDAWLNDNGSLSVVSKEPISADISDDDLEEEFPGNPFCLPFKTKGQLVGASLFSMICLQDYKSDDKQVKKTWIACERPREIIHYDGADYKYVGVQDGRMFYAREGK